MEPTAFGGGSRADPFNGQAGGARMLWTDFDSIDHESFMREALVQAEEALEAGDLPIGSVVVCDGAVLSRGRNRIRSDRSQLAHAEVAALRSGGEVLFERFEECVIYSTHEPCVMCLGSVVMADVRHVVFGARDEARGGTDMYSSVPYVRAQIRRYLGGVLEGECEAMFARCTNWSPHGRVSRAHGEPQNSRLQPTLGFTSHG